MLSSSLFKKVLLLFMVLLYSPYSFAAIENENIHTVRFNKMYFVYKEFKGPLSYNFKKETEELKDQFSAMGATLDKPAIMFVGIKPYNNKQYDFFINNSLPESKETEKDNTQQKENVDNRSYYIKNIDPVYYSTPVVVYVGFLIGGGEINESTITSSGYNFFEVSGHLQMFQIDERLYQKNLENASINGDKKDLNLQVSDMQIRDRVHMLNAMGKIKKDYIGMLEIYDSENRIYSFVGYYDNKLEEEEKLRNEAMLEDKSSAEATSEKFSE